MERLPAASRTGNAINATNGMMGTRKRGPQPQPLHHIHQAEKISTCPAMSKSDIAASCVCLRANQATPASPRNVAGTNQTSPRAGLYSIPDRLTRRGDVNPRRIQW
jgi:hypothetical protein